MALPVNWVAVLDMLVVWAVAISPWLLNRSSRRITGAIGVGLSLSIVAVEHRFAHHFQERFSSIRNTQRSWPATFDAARNEARRQSRYLTAHVNPTRAEQSKYPERATILSLGTLFLSCSGLRWSW